MQQRLRLARVPEFLREALDSGKCDVGVALLVATVPSNQQESLLAEVIVKDWTWREVAHLVEQKYRRDLRSAVFAWKKVSGAGELRVACGPCPNRGGNIEGFEGAATICTDLGCYDAKVAAHNRQLLAAVDGSVLSPEDWQREKYRGRYVSAGDPCPESRRGETYAQVLGKRLDEVALKTLEDGQVKRVIPRAVWEKVALEVMPGLAEERREDAEASAKDSEAAKEFAEHVAAEFTAGVLGWANRFGDKLPIAAWQALAALLWQAPRIDEEWLLSQYPSAETTDAVGLFLYWEKGMVQSPENWAAVCLVLAQGRGPILGWLPFKCGEVRSNVKEFLEKVKGLA